MDMHEVMISVSASSPGSVFPYVSAYMHACVSVCPLGRTVCHCVCLSACLTLHFCPLYSLSLSVCLSVSPSVYLSIWLPVCVTILLSTDMSEIHAEAQQAIAIEGLVQSSYVAARARFEPVTLRKKGAEFTTEPPRHTNWQ